jgi:uncharacterized protein (TIGR00369 family)
MPADFARPAIGGGSAERHSRVVEWCDPGPSVAARRAMAGIDYLRAMRDRRLPLPPVASLLGFDLTEVAVGRVVFTCAPDQSMYNAIGVVHGGVACALLDAAASLALLSTLPPGRGLTSVEIKVNFLKAIHPGRGLLNAEGTVVKAGSRIGFTTGVVTDGSGDLVATASSTLLVFDA